MIHNGWNREYLQSHYRAGKNGLPSLDHIKFDFEPCFPWEIQKKLDVLNFKPEVIFIDHCGLMKSRFRDEISKDAFRNGIDVASPSGSFRVSYNANKILALRPIRDGSGSIEHLELSTLKNREQERLNCRLDVDPKKNGRIL